MKCVVLILRETDKEQWREYKSSQRDTPPPTALSVSPWVLMNGLEWSADRRNLHWGGEDATCVLWSPTWVASLFLTLWASLVKLTCQDRWVCLQNKRKVSVLFLFFWEERDHDLAYSKPLRSWGLTLQVDPCCVCLYVSLVNTNARDVLLAPSSWFSRTHRTELQSSAVYTDRANPFVPCICCLRDLAHSGPQDWPFSDWRECALQSLPLGRIILSKRSSWGLQQVWKQRRSYQECFCLLSLLLAISPSAMCSRVTSMSSWDIPILLFGNTVT